MKVILYVLLAYTLYKKGVIAELIERFTIPDHETETQPQTRDSPKECTINLYSISRLELEKLAADKMKSLKIKHYYYISRVAPNDVLIEIISDR